ncbi:hypothetical protein WJ972_22720 [Achromobacter insuavis]
MASIAVVQGEQIVGRCYDQSAVRPDLFVHESRAATRWLLESHADLVLARIGGIAHQRIGVAEPPALRIAHLHDDVAAAREWRQWLAVRAFQRETLDQRACLFDAGDADVNFQVGFIHTSSLGRFQMAWHTYFISR